jgi:hypothetical protein
MVLRGVATCEYEVHAQNSSRRGCVDGQAVLGMHVRRGTCMCYQLTSFCEWRAGGTSDLCRPREVDWVGV